MHAMQHRELPSPAVAPQPQPMDALPTSWPAYVPGWFAVLLGVLAVIYLAWQSAVSPSPDLGVLVVVLLAAELLLTVYVDHDRTIALSTTFTFTIFLAFGAMPAAIASAAALAVRQVVQRRAHTGTQPRLDLVASNTLQLLTAGLVGGVVVWLVLGTPLTQAPTEQVGGVLVYAAAYFSCHVLLGSLAAWFSGAGGRERPFAAEPDVELWNMLGFALGVPLALLATSLGSRFGFTVDVLLVFCALAALSGIIHLYLQLHATNREFRVLNEVSRSLAGSLEQNKLYPAIYSRVRQVMPADVFLIGLANDDFTELDVPFLVENGEMLAPRQLPIADTLSEHVMRTGKPLYLPQGADHVPYIRFGQAGKSAEAVVVVPLCLSDEPIGVISAQSYTSEAYTPQQLALLDAIGRIAAVAINNARLFAREKEVQRSREEFVSLVAHELKNPLAALLGHTQILERRVRQADEKLRRPVNIIQEQGERMNRLVEDLLDLSRADSGRLALHLQRVDIASLVRHVVEQQDIITAQHPMTVETVDQLPLVEGDVLRLTQVLQNLLSNAVKYSPNGGPVTVTLHAWPADDARWPRRLRKTISTTTCWVVVRVADQGIGVPKDQLSSIFDRFYRANNTAQLEVTGTGLGLSVCEGLVRAQGGVIWAESEWGQGSSFSFALPVPH